jgi:outer membrane protein assembly factor BamE (lipoprotein component of BamABCDE complex)
MKPILILALAGVLLSGCVTSTVESRKKERYAAYSELTAEQRAAVDTGQIQVGMPRDAVYIAWGKPHQVLASESAEGKQEVWLYLGSSLYSYTYWGYQPYYGPYRYHYGPYLYYNYLPVTYAKAEVIFEKDVVKQWRTLPQPGY